MISGIGANEENVLRDGPSYEELKTETSRLQSQLAECQLRHVESDYANDILKAELDDYREVHEDHKRVVRELDALISALHSLAKQASLIDLFGPVRELKAELEAQVARSAVVLEASEILIRSFNGCPACTEVYCPPCEAATRVLCTPGPAADALLADREIAEKARKVELNYRIRISNFEKYFPQEDSTNIIRPDKEFWQLVRASLEKNDG